MTAPGKFYGIGVGPGDPELITLKAARILAEVDWIFLPAPPARGQGFANKIVESLRLDSAKFRPVALCMSKQRATDLEGYAQAADDILTELRRGKSAAWITEGDPLFYSTFLHVWTALRQRDPRFEVEIVPGITSIQAAAACVGVPIAKLDERVAVVSAAYGLDGLPELLDEFATVFLLKVHGVMDQLLDRLALLSRPLQASYVEKVGTAEQRIVSDLTTLRGKRLPYFSLVILRQRQGRES
jgi:precorrin-2/cobalt-factor-2 C20-methyltransferase